MTIDTLSGKVYAFDDNIHKAKKHKGQSIIASVSFSQPKPNYYQL